jgi:hypothetical protein
MPHYGMRPCSLGLKDFLDQLNLFYIWIDLYLQQIKSYGHAS